MLLHVFTLASFAALAVSSPVAADPIVDLAPRQAATLCDHYGYYAANGYEFNNNNNNWGKGSASSASQCTTVRSTSSSGVSWSTTWNLVGGQDNVKSYANASEHITWDYSNRNIRANVAYDVFTAADPNHDKSSGDYELTVWLAHIGGVYPIGDKVTTVNLAGFNWDLYIDPNKPGVPINNQNLIVMQQGTEPFTDAQTTFTVSSYSASVNV
ncbi:hypothetical protein E8E11_007376 [Didymella keratinophila]|nr:hypothetical protein E8E11_007376 [Didymella keratinophila]